MMKEFNINELAEKQLILAAHRGVSGGNIPCNCLAAYDFALTEGADMVEIDVTKSADDELFIFHPTMEFRHLQAPGLDIRKLKAEEIRKLRLVNGDGTPTNFGISTLDEVLEHLKGRCFINIDKFGDNPALIIEKVKRHNMKEQIILKCKPMEEPLAVVEQYAPDIQFLPIIWREDNGAHEMLMHRNIRYIGAELVFLSEEDETVSEAYRERLRRDGKLLWGNAILYDYKVQLSAGHSDDAAVMGDREYGWGWLADRFDIIQTDWIGSLDRYLKETGRRTKDLIFTEKSV